MRQVSAEYIEGIREGRALWRTLTPEERITDAPAYLANVERTMKEFNAGPVKDMLKGERDFWRHQIKKAKSQ